MNNNILVVLLGAGRSRRFKSNQIKQNVIINKVSILIIQDYSLINIFLNQIYS